MRIYWNGGANYKDVNIDDESFRYRKIMGENQLTLKFSMSSFHEFALGSYVSFESETYTLQEPQTFKKISNSEYGYNLTMSSSQNLMANFKIKDTSGRLKFPFTAKPLEHLQLLVNNLNANDSGWSVGDCVEGVEKLISYSHANCFDALSVIAETFETEWEVLNKTIHIKKVEYFKDAPLALSYGKGKGFVSGVGRTNETAKTGFNVLYVQGGERNIDLSVYGNRFLLLPKSQTYTYEGNVYETDADGLSVVKQGVTITSRKEESLDCTHIYPKRTGTISSVVVVDAENNLYDFIDDTIPEDLDFTDYVLDGETLTVIFESGMLSGREFDVDYQHATKKFLIVPQEYDGVAMPSDVFVPAIGDSYSIYNMMLPDAYLSDNVTETGASWEMFIEACKFFYENENTKFTFKGTLDGIWAKKDWLNIGGKIKVGGYVLFSDTTFEPEGVNIRIVGIKDNINNPHSPIIELANSVQSGTIFSEINRLIDNNEIVNETERNNTLQYTRRRWRDAVETIALLENAMLSGFGASVNPLSVQTMAILVGHETLQFRFVDNDVDLNVVTHIITFNQSTKELEAEAGVLQHMTIGVDALSPSPVYKTWDVSLFASPPLTETDKSYYLYVKASKLDNTATFYLSETAIELEEVVDYYHLLVGILNTEYEGERSFVKMYGFTEILAGQIKVDKITSGNGEQVIELLEDEIKINANVSFVSGSPAYEQIYSTIEIGGQNLILGTDEAKVYYELSERERVKYFDVERNFTMSVDAVCESDFDGYIFLVGLTELGDAVLIDNKPVNLIADVPSRLFITTSFKLSDYVNVFVKVQNEADDINVELSYPQFELGLFATDWKIADDDTIDGIEKMLRKVDFINETKIEGNTIATGILAVGNRFGANAFITGLDTGDLAIRFAAGSTWANRENAPFKVLDDGSIIASKGYIGGWEIVENSLQSADEYDENTRVVNFNSATGNLVITRDIEVFNPNTQAEPEIIKQTITIDAENGTIKSEREETNFQPASKTTLDAEGITANFAGIETGIGAGKQRSAIRADVKANLEAENELFPLFNAVIGVYGKAENTNIEKPTPAFGGWFHRLMAVGFNVSTSEIYGGRTLSLKDTYVQLAEDAYCILPDVTGYESGCFIIIQQTYFYDSLGTEVAQFHGSGWDGTTSENGIIDVGAGDSAPSGYKHTFTMTNAMTVLLILHYGNWKLTTLTPRPTV